MKTLKEKYNAIQEGNYSKAEFVRQARMELPGLISSANSFNDTVSILKNKGMIEEAKKSKTQDGNKPDAGHPASALERGIDYELEATGVNTAVETPTKEQYQKASEKVKKNLDKDPNHYLNLLSGESKNVDKHDQYTEYKDKDKVDTHNGLKKADTKVSLKEAFEDDDYERISREVEYNISSEKDEDLEESPKMDTSVDKTMSLSKVIKIAKLAGEYVPDAEAEIKELGVAFGENVPVYKVKNILKNYDLSQIKLREGMKFKKKGVNEVSFRKLKDPYHWFKDKKSYQDRLKVNDKSKLKQLISISKKKGHGLEIIGDNVWAYTNDSVEDNQSVWKYSDGYIYFDNNEYKTDYPDIIRKLFTIEEQKLQEGRRPKIKGGKVVTENDYETGGYVEAMGEQLDVAMDKVLKVWEKWKNGSRTEPGMVPHAKKDLISYFTQKLEDTVEEGEEDTVEESEQESRSSNNNAVRSTMNESQETKLKNVFKKAIINILEQDSKLLNEAKTENLEEFLHYENEDNEDLAARIREGAADLENVILGLEKDYTSTRGKIEGVYKNIGSFMAPAVAAAFKKDVKPVLNKYLNIEVPKGQRLSPEEMEKLGISADATTGTVFSLKENKSGLKRKYTKSK